MTPFRTHYDNLKVSFNAPPEVITAAYKALSRQFHPDTNPDNPQAESIMRIVNGSYEVLSDPKKRRAHDEWIASKLADMVTGQSSPPPIASSRKSLPPKNGGRSILAYIFRNPWTYILSAIAGFSIWASNQPPSRSGLPDYVAEPSEEMANADLSTPNYSRPENAPNGNTWPTTPSYIKGYPIARADGLSQLTIDNSSNSTDVFVKLIALDATQTLPVRHAFIPAGSSFTMNKIRSGKYDIRHMDLSDGGLLRSESFELEEIPEAGGVKYSVTTMTLFKVANGNMQSYQLAPEEF